MDKIMLPIVLRQPVCVEGLSEDAVRQLVDAMYAQALTSILDGFVQAPAALQIRHAADSTGNWDGLIATINSQPVTLIGGVNSKDLALKEGPPTADNPGLGWKIEPELTKKYLNVSGDESTWEIFIASRVPILNNISN